MNPAPENSTVGIDPNALPGSAPHPRPFWHHPFVQGGALLVFTLLLYWPSYRAGFLMDDEMMAGNALYKEGWRGLRDIWCTTRFGDFVPLTATSFWLEWQYFGALREIQHATNIVLHALNVVLLWRVLRRLTIPGAAWAGALFAAHPLCVTSVTWLAERKNTLSMFFYLCSFLFYLRSENDALAPSQGIGAYESLDLRRKRVFFWLSFLFFVLALLSKSSVVILPMALLLCSWWRRGRLSLVEIKWTAPFFAVALAMGVATIIAHAVFGPRMGVNPTTDDLLLRSLAGARAVWFYLAKELAPFDLTLLYPRWDIHVTSLAAYLPLVGIIACAVIFWCFRKTWGRVCIFAFGYFLLALAPSLGVVNMAFLSMAQVADHLQYLALPGVLALVAAIYQRVSQNAGQTLRCVAVLFGCVVLLALTFRSWQYQRLMADPLALWQENVTKNPNSWMVQNNLGRILANNGKLDDALAHFRAAVQLKPELVPAHYNLGRLYLLKGDVTQATQCFSNAIAINRDNFALELALADALANQGKDEESNIHYVAAHLRQAKALLKERNVAGAISEWRTVLTLKPNCVEALDNLAWIMATSRDDRIRNGAEAVEMAERLFKMGGSNVPPVLDTLAAAYAETSRFAEATNVLAKAIFLAENSGKTNNLKQYHDRLRLYEGRQAFRE